MQCSGKLVYQADAINGEVGSYPISLIQQEKNVLILFRTVSRSVLYLKCDEEIKCTNGIFDDGKSVKIPLSDTVASLNGKQNETVIIAVSAVSGVIVLALIILTICLCVRNSRKKKREISYRPLYSANQTNSDSDVSGDFQRSESSPMLYEKN